MEYDIFTVSTGVMRRRKALVRAKALAKEKGEKVVPVMTSYCPVTNGSPTSWDRDHQSTGVGCSSPQEL